MLSKLSKKNIIKKLNIIYKTNKLEKSIKIYANEIFEIINRHNRLGKKVKKLNVTEKPQF